MHKLRTLADYKRKDGWRYVKTDDDSLDLFRARMVSYRPAPKQHDVVQLKRSAK